MRIGLFNSLFVVIKKYVVLGAPQLHLFMEDVDMDFIFIYGGGRYGFHFMYGGCRYGFHFMYVPLSFVNCIQVGK